MITQTHLRCFDTRLLRPRRFVLALALATAAAACNRAADDASIQRTQAGTVAANRTTGQPLVVRILDVGQGDATLIEDGASRVLIDGGPDEHRMGKLLDSLGLNHQTFDAVILTHQHADHLVGLRALFEKKRHITVRYFFENQDPYTAANLRHLRDSINARVERGELIYRDTDDPCANGKPICVVALRGGAKLDIMRPFQGSKNPNDRSVPVKLVGPDSAAFSMWFAGDAEQDAVRWFLGAAGYARKPGMRVTVLKADHHGSCNGMTAEYLRTLDPTFATASLGDVNSYHHMHEQAKALFRARHIPWYRTDQNGTITITVPNASSAKPAVSVQKGTTDMSGDSDARSTQPECNPIR